LIVNYDRSSGESDVFPESFKAVLAKTAGGAAAAGALGDLPEWRLEDLYASMSAPKFFSDVAEAIAAAKRFADQYAGKLEGLARGPGGGAEIYKAVAAFERLEDLMGRIMSYAGLIHAADTSDPQRGKFYGDALEKITEASSDLLFFTLELNRIDDALIDRLLGEAPLDHYRPWLTDIRLEKPYQLDDRIEQLFHEKTVTGRGAWNRLFDETMSALRFSVDGEALPLEPTLNMLLDARAGTRKKASNALAETLRANSRTFTLITNTLIKDNEISNRWRGFKDVADSRHLANRVEPEVVEAMVGAVSQAYPRLSHRYYKLKAKWFGKAALDHWDRNAPLPKVEQRVISWREARETVMTAYHGFSPKMSGIAGRFFDEGWIDAPVRPGKAPGAFAHPTVPSCHPYVLLNYQGKPRDVMVLAHELGHGVHQVLAGAQGALMAPTPLTLAETASVFGEMLTFRAILAGTNDRNAKKALLAGKVEDMINTVVRQIAFYIFERRIHLKRLEGELTAESLNEIWMSVQSESLGPAVTLRDGYEVFWSYIPHFIHSPFYVYAYAFGDCLVNSLYGVYEKGHAGFAERYLDMLSAGGTKHHSELLKPFGLDARDPAFWQVGLNLIEGMIVELEGMD
jgi:oligoendopeptidase F